MIEPLDQALLGVIPAFSRMFETSRELIAPSRRVQFDAKEHAKFPMQLTFDDKCKKIIRVEELEDILISNAGLLPGVTR